MSFDEDMERFGMAYEPPGKLRIWDWLGCLALAVCVGVVGGITLFVMGLCAWFIAAFMGW